MQQIEELKTTTLVGCLLVCFTACFGQEQVTNEIDLGSDWKSFENGRYVSYQSGNSKVIYFSVDPSIARGSSLSIEGDFPKSIFIGDQLIGTTDKAVVFPMDSLANVFAPPLVFGVYSKSRPTTKLIITQTEPMPIFPRSNQAFSNFVVLGILVLSTFFTGLLYANPKLTLDYVNVVRFVSIQEREETLTAIRTGARINFIYYLFCSLALAFLILTLGQPLYARLNFFPTSQSTVLDFFSYQIKLTAIIFSLILSKLLAISLFSRMFRAKEISDFQFFNTMRVLMISALLISGVALLYTMFGSAHLPHYFFILKAVVVLLAFNVVILFFKLLQKVPFRFSHLFSYLCASEIIPLVILIKVLFK